MPRSKTGLSAGALPLLMATFTESPQIVRGQVGQRSRGGRPAFRRRWQRGSRTTTIPRRRVIRKRDGVLGRTGIDLRTVLVVLPVVH